MAIGLLGLLQACSSKNTQDAGRAAPGQAAEGTCQLQLDAGAADSASDSDGGAADAGTTPESMVPSLPTIGCLSDFNAFASLPLELTIPGVRSMNFVIDTQDQTEPYHLYFQNSQLYPLHYDFIKANLQNHGNLSDFNAI